MSQDLDKAIGERLRELRKEAGKTQAALGADVSVSYAQIQKYEGGLNTISVPMAVRIASALGTTLAEWIEPIEKKWRRRKL